ncbi:MAG: hypothetical protein AAF551_07995 [Bacteroidota bacterium]
MKYHFPTLILLIFSIAFSSFGQQAKIDSLLDVIATSKVDTTKVDALLHLSNIYVLINADSCLPFAEQALAIATDKQLLERRLEALNIFGINHSLNGETRHLLS